MSTKRMPNRQRITAIGQLLLVPQYNSIEGASKVQETIWQLRDEVRVLQEELARTRRALDQRAVLLRNARQRELELRAEAGAGGR